MKLLFIRISAMGDIVQAGAALRIYRDQNPQVKISWVVDSTFVPLVQGFGVADEVIAVSANRLLKGAMISRSLHLLKIMLQMRRLGPFDVICTAHPDWRFSLLACLNKAKKTLSPKPSLRGGGFIVNRNRVYEYYRLLTGKDQGLLPIDHALVTNGSQLISSLANDYLAKYLLPKQFVALVPGGAKNLLRDDPLRRWPIENYVLLAKELAADGRSVVLLGGPDDTWVSEYFSGIPIVNLIGKTNLLEMLGVLQNAKCIVAHDSGPIHLASMTQTPLVGIFGPTSANAVLSFSRFDTVILQPENKVSCSPCYDSRGYAACESNLCMQVTTADTVLLSVNRLVSD